MTQAHQDPAVEWADQLTRLDGVRHDAVVAALRHSDATGWPAPREAVELLVAYALGEITAHDYATGILHTLGVDDRRSRAARTTERPSAPGEVAAEVESVPAAEASVSPRPAISREDAVHAYVTGQIPVGEFLRLARG